MNPATLSRQIRESSGSAPTTARGMGAAALPTILPFLSDTDDDIRLTAAECLAAIATSVTEPEPASQVETAAIKLLTDDDDQTASTGINILHKVPPKDANAKLARAWSMATVDFVKEHAPIIAGYHGTEQDRTPWEGFLVGESDPDIVGGLHTGLAKMGLAPSRLWFQAKLVDAKLQASDIWIDRAVYMADPWVVPTLVKMLDREDTAYTVSPDEMPKAIRVKDLAANAILVILKPPPGDKAKPVPTPVSKRRYTPEEINQVREIARPYAEKP